MKDVVRAYKGLVKEKETLETTLKTITDASQQDAKVEITILIRWFS